MKTQSEHIESKGSVCPFCGSEEIEGYSTETGHGKAVQRMSCMECDGDWTDTYKLTGYTALRIQVRDTSVPYADFRKVLDDNPGYWSDGPEEDDVTELKVWRFFDGREGAQIGYITRDLKHDQKYYLSA